MGVGMTGQDTTLELINAEIDGVLTGPQRAELNRLLLADPSVRALRDGLTRTCRALDEMPREEVPAGLRDAIVTGLPAAAAPKSHGFRRTLVHQPSGAALCRLPLPVACWSARWLSSWQARLDGVRRGPACRHDRRLPRMPRRG